MDNKDFYNACRGISKNIDDMQQAMQDGFYICSNFDLYSVYCENREKFLKFLEIDIRRELSEASASK